MEVKGILKDQKSEIKDIINRKNIVKRDAQTHFKNIFQSKLVKITTGIRRSGKSIFTYIILKNESFGYVNFDDDRLIDVKSDDIFSALLEIHGNKLKVLFFDEIQNLDNWELFINRLNRLGYNIFITGSNSKLLSKELATHLTGRHISMEIFPFSFAEYLKAIKFDEDLETARGTSLAKHELENYLLNGGFPEIVVEKENPKIYLRELYRKIVERDIILRYNIAYKKTFKEISLSMLSNPGRLISYNKIKRQFKLGSDHTVKNYLSYLEESYLILPLNKFSYKPREIESSEKKIYAIDTGMANHAGIKSTKDNGPLLENIIAIELFRRKSFNQNMEIYYWKDYQQREVDFVVKEGLKVKQLMQATYISNREQIKPREIRGLLEASKELKCNNLIIITWDCEGEERIDGKKIKFIPLWKWLLS
ncbi:MAG: ATP-binding protein [Candidatus Aenigmarchaeota archaeon]|nr:ATP-binding protein [Candidatus Aenigmarchaeota archaeon]